MHTQRIRPGVLREGLMAAGGSLCCKLPGRGEMSRDSRKNGKHLVKVVFLAAGCGLCQGVKTGDMIKNQSTVM